ncbi:MAG TPA: CHAD domain-containing protein [Pseudonocardiaceae bacterium]|nr:CHAD domain-containing protein [Pseudonocardiaceae bacterium]
MTAAALTRPPARRRAPRLITAGTLRLADEPRAAERTDSLTAHIRATVDAGLRVLLTEQDTAGQADEPESVHQMRVAARRMRVALRMDRGGIGTAAETLRAELSWLAGVLGAVRDLDVLCERLARDGADLPENDLRAFAEVLSALLASREAAADVLAKSLAKPRYRALLQGLAAEARSAADDGERIKPASLLIKPVRALHLQLVASAQSPSDDAWHMLRIRVKRARYAADVAADLAGPKQRARILALSKQAKAVQEVLGDFQDTVITEHHLRQLAAAHPGDLSAPALLVAGRLIERQVVKRAALRERLPAATGELYRATTTD